jgi:hypothetical protein
MEEEKVIIKKKASKKKKPLIRDAYSPLKFQDEIEDRSFLTDSSLNDLADESRDIPSFRTGDKIKEPISIFDLIISVYKNAGGDYKVGIFHKPSGIEVFEDSYGSIYRNRVAAMQNLQERLKIK